MSKIRNIILFIYHPALSPFLLFAFLFAYNPFVAYIDKRISYVILLFILFITLIYPLLIKFLLQLKNEQSWLKIMLIVNLLSALEIININYLPVLLYQQMGLIALLIVVILLRNKINYQTAFAGFCTALIALIIFFTGKDLFFWLIFSIFMSSILVFFIKKQENKAYINYFYSFITGLSLELITYLIAR